MTDPTTTVEGESRPEWGPRKRKGKGVGKTGPSIVFNGSNIVGDEPPPKRAEPVEYSEELADRICTWLAAGKSLRSFCLQEGTPSTTSVMNWTLARPDFDLRYARARDEGIDRIAEMAMDELIDPNLPPEQVQRVKYAFEARKWFASKIAPRRYGDRIEVKNEISGPNGQPIAIQVQALVGLIENPLVAERLSETHLLAIREAVALLAAPVDGAVPGGGAEAAGVTIESEAIEVPPGE